MKYSERNLTKFFFVLQSPDEWKIVFYIAGSIYLAGAVIYGLFASGEVQSWAKPSEEKQNGTHAYDNKAMQLDKNGD